MGSQSRRGTIMKTYRVSRPYLWLMAATKVVLTVAAIAGYAYALSHPTAFVFRLALLVAILLLGWYFYVRLPRVPRELAITDDGWVLFQGRRGLTRVHAASIRSIAQSLGRRTVRLRHEGGKLRVPNRYRGFYDFLSTVRSFNPAVEIRGF
jgi:hypothetical protein